jgi:hypothetical protein
MEQSDVRFNIENDSSSHSFFGLCDPHAPVPETHALTASFLG